MSDQYAVIGNPISHSLSPDIHQAFAKQTGRVLRYERLLASPKQFIPMVREFFASGGKGLNITRPFKEQAFLFVDQYSERAAQAKAVNTILCLPDGKLYGDNTDGIGLVRDLTVNRGIILKNKKILLLGAGGAVRGVLGALLVELPAEIMIANRTVEKAEQLAREFSGVIKVYDDSNDFDLVINGTPILSCHPPAPSQKYYDMNYKTSQDDGFGMLVEQAAEAFFLWHGVRPETRNFCTESID